MVQVAKNISGSVSNLSRNISQSNQNFNGAATHDSAKTKPTFYLCDEPGAVGGSYAEMHKQENCGDSEHTQDNIVYKHLENVPQGRPVDMSRPSWKKKIGL